MKNYFLIFLLSFSFSTFSQKVIIDEKINDKEKPFSYFIKSKDIFVSKGYTMPFYNRNVITKMDRYGLDSSVSTIFNNEKIRMSFFSPVDSTTFKSIEYPEYITDNFINGDYKFYVSNKFVSSISNSDYKSFVNKKGMKCIEGGVLNFTKDYVVGLTNQKLKNEIDFRVDDLFLELMGISTKSISRYKIEKPDVGRLIGNNFIEPEEKLGFKVKILSNSSFEIITKSISRDYKTCLIYRTFYNFKGSKIDEKIFKINLSDYSMIYSDNNGGFTESTTNGKYYFEDDLSINNFSEDNEGNVYFQGLFSDIYSKLNKNVKPLGYYVFKFDKNGNKIWESINRIDVGKDFNESLPATFYNVDLVESKDQIIFNVSVFKNKPYSYYAVLDPKTGLVLKSNKLIFEPEISRSGISLFLSSSLKMPDSKDNKKFNDIAIIAFDLNKQVSDYIKNVKSKKEVTFFAFFVDEGILLFESDNKEYYKAILFN